MIETLADYRDVNIIECDDVTSVLPRLVCSGNILLVTSKGFVKRGTVSRLLESLGTDRVMVFGEVTPNPEKSHLQRASGEFAGRDIKQVIALGGGSVIDAAKVFCALLSYPNSSLDELLSTDVVESRINLIAIPTTSGTGAEVTPFATVWQSDIGKKYSLYGVRPNIAILDPKLTKSLPEKQTLYPSLDALSHAIESLWNINSTEQSREYALYASDLICDNLPLVLNNPDDLLGRKNLQIASSAAGMAISITKTAIAHAISYPLTMQFNVPHGLACSFTINSIINIFGAEQLNLDSDLALKVQALLRSLNLPKEIESYVNWDILLNELNTQLDPSRTGNFIVDFDKLNVKNILLGAQAIGAEDNRMKTRTLLFGAGPGAKLYIEKFSETRDFVAILDNDPEKLGVLFCGMPIDRPSKIQDYVYDEIVITTQWVDEVKKQLIDTFNINEEIILVPRKNTLKGAAPFYDFHTIALGQEIILGISKLSFELDVPLIIDFGTLLGIVRDKNIIAWDDDIDFAVLPEHAQQAKKVLHSFSKTRPDINWKIEIVEDAENQITSLQLLFDDPLLQLIPFITSVAVRKSVDGKSIHLPSLGMWYAPQEHFESCETVAWRDQKLKVPSGYIDYLTFLYGDWKKPVKSMSYNDYANLQDVSFERVKSAKWKTKVIDINRKE